MSFGYQDITHLHIEVTNRCNAACPVCPRSLNGGPLSPQLALTHITAGTMREWLKPDFLSQITNVLLCGNTGDPCSNPDTPEIVRYLVEHMSRDRCYFTIITNGSLRSPEWWAELARVMPKIDAQVVFSIDGLKDTNHIYRRNTRWDRIMENAAAFIDAGGRAYWDYLVFRHNEHQIEETRALAKTMGFFEFNTKRPLGFEMVENGKHLPLPAYKRDGTFDYAIYPARNPQYHQLRYPVDEDHVFPDRIEHVPTSVQQYMLDDFSEETFDHPNELEETQTVIACKSTPEVSQRSGHELFITAYGEVYPCCWIGSAMRSDWVNFSHLQLKQRLTRYGQDQFDLKHHTMAEILSGPAFRDVFVSSWDKSGPRCGKLSVCSQTCGTKALMDNIYTDKSIIAK